MADSSFRGVEVVWRVLPLAAPRILRPCARCNRVRPFASTEKFRINAQQRHLDVWLLYACAECERTWKRDIFQRRRPDEIDPDLYRRMLCNDAETAWRYAFVSEPGLRFEMSEEARVERDGVEETPSPPYTVRLAVPFPTGLRLDRLLASELALSRSALQRAVERGTILVDGGSRALRSAIRNDAAIVVQATL